jgi:hypothetical protein
MAQLCERAVEIRQYPKEPVRIPHDYFWEGFALVFAERHSAPAHVFYVPSAALNDFASSDYKS